MQHAGQAHVVHVDGVAGDLGRDVAARHRVPDESMCGQRLERRGQVEPQLDMAAGDQRAIVDAAAVGRLDAAVAREQVGRGQPPARRRLRQQPGARLRRGGAQRLRHAAGSRCWRSSGPGWAHGRCRPAPPVPGTRTDRVLRPPSAHTRWKCRCPGRHGRPAPARGRRPPAPAGSLRPRPGCPAPSAAGRVPAAAARAGRAAPAARRARHGSRARVVQPRAFIAVVPPRAARRPGSRGACRSGTGCGSARRAVALRSAPGSPAAARPR